MHESPPRGGGAALRRLALPHGGAPARALRQRHKGLRSLPCNVTRDSAHFLVISQGIALSQRGERPAPGHKGVRRVHTRDRRAGSPSRNSHQRDDFLPLGGLSRSPRPLVERQARRLTVAYVDVET